MSTQINNGVMAGFSDLGVADMRRIRESDDAPVDAIGFATPDGGTAPIPGDDRYPHFISPPDVFGPQLYTDTITVPLAAALADMTALAAIDVRGAKTLQIDFFWTVEIAAVPVWVLEKRVLGADPRLSTARWVPAGVVNATLTAGLEDYLGYRDVYASELRLPAATAQGLKSFYLTYDVFELDVVRLRVGDVVAADTTVQLAYTLSR